MSLGHKLARVVKRHEELAALMASEGPQGCPGIRPHVARICRAQRRRSSASWPCRRRSRSRPIWRRCGQDAGGDAEMRAMAEEELRALKQRLPDLEQEVKLVLLPKDEADERNAILEVRAGTGGEEAALFAAELFRMYTRYAEGHGWRVERAWHQRDRPRRLQGGHHGDHRPRRLRPAQVRIRRASGPARAGDRGERAHPHLGRDRRGAARGRGGRHPDRGQGPAHRRLPLERAGRPVGQHDRQRRAHHPSADRPRGAAAGREIAAQEQGQGAEGAARAALRAGAQPARRRARRLAQEPGRQRRPLRAHPHLQLSRRAASPITAST